MGRGAAAMEPEPKTEFEKAAGEANEGFLREFWAFLRHNKKWWLVPLIVMLLLMGLLFILGNSPAMPFIYTIF
jgi:Family of unknown function (DUF5989)